MKFLTKVIKDEEGNLGLLMTPEMITTLNLVEGEVWTWSIQRKEGEQLPQVEITRTYVIADKDDKETT